MIEHTVVYEPGTGAGIARLSSRGTYFETDRGVEIEHNESERSLRKMTTVIPWHRIVRIELREV